MYSFIMEIVIYGVIWKRNVGQHDCSDGRGLWRDLALSRFAEASRTCLFFFFFPKQTQSSGCPHNTMSTAKAFRKRLQTGFLSVNSLFWSVCLSVCSSCIEINVAVHCFPSHHQSVTCWSILLLKRCLDQNANRTIWETFNVVQFSCHCKLKYYKDCI